MWGDAFAVREFVMSTVISSTFVMHSWAKILKDGLTFMCFHHVFLSSTCSHNNLIIEYKYIKGIFFSSIVINLLNMAYEGT